MTTFNPDVNRDGQLNTQDFNWFMAQVAAGNIVGCDVNQDGRLDIRDFMAFQSSFAAAQSAGTDNSGWTSPPPIPSGCRACYIDTVYGDDNASGLSDQTPVKTTHQAGILAPSGDGNHWVFRRGRPLPQMQNWAFRGASTARPFVIRAYGPDTDPRPFIPCPAGTGGLVLNDSLGWVQVYDLELIGNGGGYGLVFGIGCHDMLAENCYVHGFGINVYMGPEGHTDPRASNLKVRRCISVDSRGPTGDSHGFMATRVDNILFEDCIADKNGLSNSADRSHGGYCTYGQYLGDPVSLCTGVSYKNFLASRNQCAGFGMRGGGSADGILCVDNAIALGFGHGQNLPEGTNNGCNVGSLSSFVFEGAHDQANNVPEGTGLSCAWVQQLDIRRGVIHHAGPTSTGARYPFLFEYWCGGVTMGQVFVIDWTDAGHPNPINWRSNNPNPFPVDAINQVAPAGAKTLTDYAATRGFASRDAWLDSLRLMDRRNWVANSDATEYVLGSYGL